MVGWVAPLVYVDNDCISSGVALAWHGYRIGTTAPGRAPSWWDRVNVHCTFQPLMSSQNSYKRPDCVIRSPHTEIAFWSHIQ